MSKQSIELKGVRVHNLKNIDLNIKLNQFVVITGVSGSGKSSLAFDTLYAEGQRRYVESLSSYARQFLGRLNKPECDYIKGIPPAVAIEQKVNTSNRVLRSGPPRNFTIISNYYTPGSVKLIPLFREKRSNAIAWMTSVTTFWKDIPIRR